LPQKFLRLLHYEPRTRAEVTSINDSFRSQLQLSPVVGDFNNFGRFDGVLPFRYRGPSASISVVVTAAPHTRFPFADSISDTEAESEQSKQDGKGSWHPR